MRQYRILAVAQELVSFDPCCKSGVVTTIRFEGSLMRVFSIYVFTNKHLRSYNPRILGDALCAYINVVRAGPRFRASSTLGSPSIAFICRRSTCHSFTRSI